MSVKFPIILAVGASCLLLSSCKDEDGSRVPPRAPSPDGTNTSSSGVHDSKPETPPSTTTGVKGTGAGTDAPDDPSKANPPAVRTPPPPQP